MILKVALVSKVALSYLLVNVSIFLYFRSYILDPIENVQEFAR